MTKSAVKTSVRQRSAYRCEECGLIAARWMGRCPECRAWGSLAAAHRLQPVSGGAVAAPALPIGRVDAHLARPAPTGVSELDRVLGGGIVPGAVVLVAGEPGIGKSTLLLDVAARVARAGRRALVVTGEESAGQVRMRADRVDAVHPELFLAAETELAAVLAHVDSVEPAVLVVDSVQTIAAPEIDGTPGGVSQVRHVAAALIAVAKQRGISVLLVGHVTKDGAIAGPRALEHLVDVVVQFEGERGSRLRLLRAHKNRFGPTDEIGCFEIDAAGIRGVSDPSGLFLSRHGSPVPGTCVTVAIEGRRPLLVEVQALVAATPLASPRRATAGVDPSRLAMVLAVLERRAGVQVANRDVYAATVGGVRLADPAADLAIAVALASSSRDVPCPPAVVAVGEVGLAGELRPVRGLPLRLAEAARLGFRRALVPAGSPDPPGPITAIAVSTIGEALDALHRQGPLSP